MTYLHGERDRLTVSGLKGDNIFYRKVMLACGGTVWRHRDGIYGRRQGPARPLHRIMSRGFEQIADDSCADNLFSSPQPASAPKSEERPAN